MFIQPSKRDRPLTISTEPPNEGTFLHRILNPPPTDIYEFKKQRVLYQDTYLKALERNNKEMGIPFVEPTFPPHISSPVNDVVVEPELPFVDRIYVNFKILKSGVVRIKIVPHFLILYEQYYKLAVIPPLKLVIQAYKARGFSDDFITNIKKCEQKRLAFVKKVPDILKKIFDKDPVKKVKKWKPPLQPVEEDKPLVSEEVEEDNPLDIEPDDDDVNEEAVEEEYFIDDDED
jgi:hypothetical protein